MTVQRIAARPTAPMWLRVFYRLQARIYGAVLEPTRVWARAPTAMRGFLHFYRAVDRDRSPIDPELRALVMVKVSQINACAFCVDLNAATLEKRGASAEKIAELACYETSPLYTAKQRAALDYAAAMTRGGVADVTFGRLRDFFDDDAIVELTALVALQNASSKFNAALNIPAQGFCTASRA